MAIDDLKAIWDSQDRQPPYVINDTALRSTLQERSRRLRRDLWSNEVRNYWTGLWIAGFLAYLFWRGYPVPGASHSAYFLAMAAAVAALVYYVFFSIFFVGRRRLQSHMPDFSSSLRERLDCEAEYLNYQVACRTRWIRVLLHLVPPWLACIAIVWGMTIRDGESLQLADLLSFAVVTGGWVHMCLIQRRWVYRELVPRLRELEALRGKLDEPESDPSSQNHKPSSI